MKTTLLLYWLILSAPTTPQDRVNTCFQLFLCEETEITSAIILFETGYLKCYQSKILCSQKRNNLFGFMLHNQYLAFDNYAESVKYYRRWQIRHWHRFKRKYPQKNYYDFLKWRGYCNNMNQYISIIKQIKK